MIGLFIDLYEYDGKGEKLLLFFIASLLFYRIKVKASDFGSKI